MAKSTTVEKQIRTFKHCKTGETIEISFHMSGPFLYATIMYPEYDGNWCGERGHINYNEIDAVLYLLEAGCPVEIPTGQRITLRRQGTDGEPTFHPGHGADSLTVDADDPYICAWFRDILLYYKGLFA